MKTILAITRKELNATFGSPMALIFIGAFLAASLFTFFWVDTFFARGIADVRPLFRWMPILLIFLVATLTMRQWSEEQRSGTLELLLTLPAQIAKLVLGKFLAVLILVALALALTLPLVITVAALGNLDFGPVIGGYVAALLLASAYTAIGLFSSSRTDNQVVALIVTVLIGGALYLVGAGGVTDFVGGGVAELLRAIGTGSRFESIERGVIDLRDLIYYGTLTALFLALNVLSLDRKRWSKGPRTADYRRNMGLTGALLAANLIALNVWVSPLQVLRADLTEQQEFSLSQTTKDLLSTLQEPLLVRAYISEKTHPLLAPLAPRVRDLLREYAIAGNNRVTAEVVDPASDPTLETEAGRTYGIQPTPFQVSARYESSLINAYFDILVRYGDQNTVLNFRDLIEVEPRRDGSTDVRLRNLEYDLTRAIKKVAFGFQNIDAVFNSLNEPASLMVVVTPNTLPDPYKQAPAIIEKVAADLQSKSGGKFTYQVINPDEPNAPLDRAALRDRYQIQATPVSFFSADTFYLNLLLTINGQPQAVYPEGDFSEATVRAAIESALKRASTGFVKVVGLWAAQEVDPYGQPAQPTTQMISQQLQRDYSVRNIDLSSGQVPPDIDVLMLIGPRNFGDRERYAVDQYLMRGGSVVVAAGNYTLQTQGQTGPVLEPVQNGIRDLLEHYGVKVGDGLVMDPQNEPFPSEVNREVNGMVVREIQALNYPFFIDVRAEGMDHTNPIVSQLPVVTMQWASPIEIDQAKNSGRKVSALLHSTAQSWLRTNPDIQPNYQLNPDNGFPVEGDRKPFTVAVAIQGTFESFYKGRQSPLLVQPTPAPNAAQDGSATPTAEPVRPSSTLESSPDTARLVVIGSNEFINDLVLQLSSRMSQDRYLNNLQFAQNAVDWSVEDLDLLTIRARGTSTRVLRPLADNERTLWEVGNYVVALLALISLGVIWRVRQRSEAPMELTAIEG